MKKDKKKLLKGKNNNENEFSFYFFSRSDNNVKWQLFFNPN